MNASYKRVGDLIDRLEIKIDAGLVTPGYIEGVRHQLRSIATPEDGHDNRYSQYVQELQALTYRAQGKDEEALKYINAALREVGSPEKLRSRLLKTYVRDNRLPVPEHQRPSVARTGPGDLSLLNESQRAFMRSYGLASTPNVDLLVREPTKFAAMYILSGGYYEWYWTYKNWQAIRDASERKLSPFWRTFFNIFYIVPLFRAMTLLAKSRGFKERISGGWLAAGYILIFAVGCAVTFFTSSRILLAILQVVYIGANVTFYGLEQRAAAFGVSKQPQTKNRPVNYVEWIFVVVGAILTIYVVGHIFSSAHTSHSTWQQLKTNSVGR